MVYFFLCSSGCNLRLEIAKAAVSAQKALQRSETREVLRGILDTSVGPNLLLLAPSWIRTVKKELFVLWHRCHRFLADATCLLLACSAIEIIAATYSSVSFQYPVTTTIDLIVFPHVFVISSKCLHIFLSRQSKRFFVLKLIFAM